MLSEKQQLKEIRNQIANSLRIVQRNTEVILYLKAIHQDSKFTRGMLYSFENDFLFMEELKGKLGDWYKPGDAIRILCPKTGLYKLIEDEFNFYAAVQSIKPEVRSPCFSMDIYINGAELKK